MCVESEVVECMESDMVECAVWGDIVLSVRCGVI